MVLHEESDRSTFDKTVDAVNDAAESVQKTTEAVAGAIENSRRHGGMLDQLSRFTREAPLRSLAIAFAIGFMVARRR